MSLHFKLVTINVLLILEFINLISAYSFSEIQDNNNSINNNTTKVLRMLTEMETGRGMINHDYHEAEEPKAQKPWLGYYDFLITEGSYKFWVVFQLERCNFQTLPSERRSRKILPPNFGRILESNLGYFKELTTTTLPFVRISADEDVCVTYLFTIAVLIYSAFAAIYYAKYTINDYENYDDYLFGRSVRSVSSVPPTQTAFLGLPVETYLRIFNAVTNYGNK